MAKKQNSTMYNGNQKLFTGAQGVPMNHVAGNNINASSKQASQLSAISSKRANQGLRKRMTSDVHMIAIQ